VTDLLIARVQMARLLERIRSTWSMSGDPGSTNLVFLHPVDLHERNPLIWVPATDLFPAQEFRGLGRRDSLRFAHGASVLSSPVNRKFSRRYRSFCPRITTELKLRSNMNGIV
jgi:hypothetical protein